MTPEEFSKANPSESGQDQETFSYPASAQNSITLQDVPHEFNDGVFSIPDEVKAEWKSKGEIGMFESFQRLDKTEMIPLWGGVESTYKSVQLLNAVNRIKEDKYPDDTIRQNDIDSVSNFLMKQEEERVRGVTLPGMITSGVAQTLPFMAEFVLTGGVASMVKGGARAGLKYALQEGVERNIARFATRAAGSVAVGATRTLLSPQRIAANTTQRRLQSNFEITDKGISLMDEAKEGWASALMKGTADTFIEQWSEEQGAFMTRVGGRFIPKPLRSSIEKVFKRLHPNMTLKNLYSKTGFNGFIEEMGEEGLGELLRAVTGVEDFGADDPHRMLDRVIAAFDDPDKWLATAGVIAFQGGAGLVFEHGLNALAGEKPRFQKRTEPGTARELTDQEVNDLAAKYGPKEGQEGAAGAEIPGEQAAAEDAALEAGKAVDGLLDQANQPGSPLEPLKPVLEGVKEALDAMPQPESDVTEPEDGGDASFDFGENEAPSVVIFESEEEKQTIISEKKKQGAISALEEKLQKINDKVERARQAKPTKDYLDEIHRFFLRRIKPYSKGREAEEFEGVPNVYVNESKGSFMDDIMSQANNMDFGLNFQSENQLVDFLQGLIDRRREVARIIKEGREEFVRRKESSFLKQRIKDLEAGEKYGYSQGYKEARKKVSELMKLKVDKIKNMAKWIQNAKDAVSDYARAHLPKEIQGKALIMVRDAKTGVDVYDAYQKIDKLAESAQKEKLIAKLKGMIEKIDSAKNISIDYKQRIQAFLKDFDLGKRSAAFRRSLENTKAWIDLQLKSGKDPAVEQYIYDSLKILDQTNIRDLSNEEIESMIDTVNLAVELGKTKLAARQAVKDAEKARIIKEAEADGRPINSKDVFGVPGTKKEIKATKKGIGKKLTLWQKIKNRFVDEFNLGQLRNMARQPIDHMFSMLGDSVYKNFKKRMDARYSDYKIQWREIRDKARELGQKLGLTEDNYERIGVYAADQQENGRKKLLLRYTKDEIEAVNLTREESVFYEFMRSELDKIRPQYEKMLKEVFNLPLGKVVNYFPFMTDYSQFEDWTIEHHFNALGQSYDPHLKKTVDLTPQKERVDKTGNQYLKVNALEVFEDHMEAVVYAINTADSIKTLQEVAGTEDFRISAGNIGQKMIREWLDLMARMGWSGKKKADWEKKMDFVRKAVGAKALIANANSILLQVTAMMDGAGLIGGWAFKGQAEVTKRDGEWRKFALDQSGKLKERIGDDPAFREMGKTWFDKLRSAGFIPQRWVDSMVAAGVWIGAYQKYCQENNIEADTKNPNLEARLYADKIVQMTQSSSEFIDAPLLLTRGIGFGDSESWAKFIFQFQGPLFARYSNLVDIGGKALAEGDKRLFAQIAGWNAAATISEMLIRHGTKAMFALILTALFGASGDPEKDEDDESNPIFNFLGELLATEAGNIPYFNLFANALEYGSIPVPAISMIQQLGENYNWYQRSKNPDKKIKWGIILALEASGIVSGIPPSALTKIVKQYFNAADDEGSIGT